MRPNILLITTDQQRHDALGINGNEILQTPNLDWLASSGVNFKRAYTTCPVCIPARRTIISGLHPTAHGLVRYQDGLDWEPPFTLPGLLGDAGYQTQLIGKLHLHPQRRRYGFDNIILSETPNHRPTSKWQPHNDYADWLRDKGVPFHPVSHGVNSNSRIGRPFHLDEDYHHTSWLIEEAVKFTTKTRDPSCPWFLHLSIPAPHPPLVPPRDYFERYASLDLQPTIGEWANKSAPLHGINPVSAVGPFKEVEIQSAIAGYYGLIHHIDDRISHLLDRYFEYGNPRSKESLWVLFTSDHGEMLGDHHLFRKSLPYEASSHIPFFVSGFNIEKSSSQSDALVSLEDIAPTLLDLAGVQIPEGMDGKSLAPFLQGQTPETRETIFGECGSGGKLAHQFMVEGDLKYIWFAKTNEEQLFNLKEDPQERSDLSADEELLQPLRAKMAAHLEGREDYQYIPSELKPCRNYPPRVFWD